MTISVTSGFGAVTNLMSGARWDAACLHDAVERRAAEYAKRGLRRGTTALICHGGDGEFFADLFAVWRCGARAACLNPRSAPTEIETIAGFVDPVLALTTTELALPESLADITVIGSTAQGTGDHASSMPGAALDDDALILFTSGTTGIPKGVVHTFRSLLARTALNRSYIGAQKMARTMCVLPTHFGHGLIGNCLTPLLAGCDVMLAPGSNLDVMANLGRLIDDNGITFLSSVPTFWKKILHTADAPKSGSLERVHLGSAPLSTEVWDSVAEWCGTRDVVNMYGITETANWIAGASLVDYPAQDGLIGAMWGGAAAILREDGTTADAGEGELLIQSPSVMRCYLDRPDLTSDAFRGGWYRTGDIGHIDPDGVIRLTGRQKYEINRAGIKIYPEDVDLMVERHPFVLEACTFAIPDETENQLVGIAIVLNENGDTGPRELRRWCNEHMAPEKHPQRWFFLTDIPKTDRGKINRANVAQFCIDNAATVERRR